MAQFNPGTGANSIVYKLNRATGQDNNSYPLIDKANDVNESLDRFWFLALTSSGTRRFDDSNNNPASDPPVFTQNLVSGQQSYTIPSTVLVIDQILAKDSQGEWQTLQPVDVSGSGYNRHARNIWELPANNGGSPTHFDETANALLLDPIPNYNSTNGLKIVGSRGPTYLTAADTTATPGIPSIFHSYLVHHAAMLWLIDKDVNRYRVNAELVKRDEEAIEEYFALRSATNKARITSIWRSSR